MGDPNFSDAEDESTTSKQQKRFYKQYDTLIGKHAMGFEGFDKTLYEVLKESPFNINHSTVLTTKLVNGYGTVVAGHLAHPITAEDQQAILTYDEKNMRCRRHREWCQIRKNNNISGHMYDGSTSCKPYICVPGMINHIAKYYIRRMDQYKYLLDKSSVKQRLSLIYDLALENTILKRYNFERPLRNILPDYPQYKRILTERYCLNDNDIIQGLFETKMIAEVVKDVFCNMKILSGKFRMPHPHVLYDNDSTMFLCPIHNHIILSPTTLWINNLDMMQSDFAIHLSWLLSDVEGKYGAYSIFREGHRIWTRLKQVRDNKEMVKFYDFLGKWEALIIGSIIKQPNDEGCSNLYNEIISGISVGHQVGLIPYILPKHHTLDEQRMYLEIVGINKSFGHPCLDMATSLDVVREYGGKKLNILPHAMFNVVSKLKEIFCKTHYSKHQRYPPIRDNGNLLCDIMIRQNRPILRSDKIPLSMYGQLVFEKTFDFDYNFETAALVKDTASSPLMSGWSSSFDNCAFYELYNKPHPGHGYSYKDTRVILNYLAGSPDDVKCKIEELESMYWNPEHQMCSYCRKEREIKDDGRVFVKQCYLQRLIQVIKEQNIANCIFKYYEDQTMTDTEVQVLKRQELLSKPDQGCEIIINIDLSKWNLHFRDESVRPVGEFLDQLFGFKHLYAETHRWFLLAQIFCNSRLCPPDYDPETKLPLPGPFFINNHLGGGEGMCQKLWTLINIGVIRLTAENLGVRVDVMGQGDNQVVLMKLNKYQAPNKELLRKEFMSALHTNFEAIGLKLKLQETWYSRRLFEYGKQRYLDGVAVSNMTKKMSRLIPDINDGIPSLQSYFAQINTTTEGACKTELTCFPAYLQNQIEQIILFYRFNIVNNKTLHNDITKLLYFPTVLGGFPSSLYFSHTVRGNDDPLPQWISLIQDIRRLKPDLYKYVIKTVDFNSTTFINYENLIVDIRSLNNKPLLNTESIVKDCTLDFLMSDRGNVTNREITKLFDPNTTIPMNSIIESLMTMRPLLLPLAHEILRLSNAGILLSLQNKLTNVTTITKIVDQINHYDFYNYSLLVRAHIIHSVKNRNISNSREIDVMLTQNYCPTYLSTKLRKEHWNCEMVAPTKPTQTHQFLMIPLDQASPIDRKAGIIVTVSDLFRTVRDISILQKGPYESYIGNKTKEKLIEPLIKLTNRPPELKCYQTLYTIKTWCQSINGYNIEKLIDILLLEKTPDLPAELEDIDDALFCPRVSGGNIVHRLKGALEKNMGVRNINPSIGSHFSFSTNMMTTYNKGGADYTLHFQNAYHYSEALLISMKFLKFHDIESQYCFTVICPECTEDVTDVSLDIDPPNILTYLQPSINKPNNIKVFDSKEIGTEDEIRQLMSLYIGRLVGRQIDIESNRTYITYTPSNAAETGRLKDVSTYFVKTLDFDWLLMGIYYESNIFKKFLLDQQLLSSPHINTDVMSKFGSMVVEGERINDFILWSRTDLITHSSVLNSRDLGNMMFKSLLNIVLKNPWKYTSRLLNPLFADEDPFKLQTLLIWIKSNQEKLCPNTELIVIRDPSYFIYDIPRHTHIQDTYIRSEHSEKREFAKKLLLSCISKKYQKVLSFPGSTTLTAYKIVNTRDKIDISHLIPVTPPIFEVGHLYSINTVLEYNHKLMANRALRGVATPAYKIPFIQHMGRILGCISTAATKYCEIIRLLNFSPCVKPSLSIHLAEGSGSVLWLFSNLFNCDVSYNTLMSPDVDSRKHQSMRVPPASLSSNGYCRHKLKHQEILAEGETDICTSNFQIKFKGLISGYSNIYLTIDAESTTNATNFTILTDYLKIMMHYDNISLMICKILVGCTQHWVMSLREDIEKFITEDMEWTFIKPISSHPCNGEFFVCVVRKPSVPASVVSAVIQLQQIFNHSVCSSYPYTDFTESDLRIYIEAANTTRSMIEETLLRQAPHLRYRNKFTRQVTEGLYCGICCYYAYNDHIKIMQTLTTSPDILTELSMNVLTRRAGTQNVLHDVVTHVFYTLVYNFSDVVPISARSLITAARFVIIWTGYNSTKPYIWHKNLDRHGLLISTPYENEEVKNIYREGTVCRCVDIMCNPELALQFLLILFVVERVTVPHDRLYNFFISYEQFRFLVYDLFHRVPYDYVREMFADDTARFLDYYKGAFVVNRA